MFRHCIAWLCALVGLATPLERKLLRYDPNHQVSERKTPYALVTGATDGIGEALAIELASAYGFNIVLHGRNPAKLETTKQQVLDACAKRGRAPVDVLAICADASKSRELDFEEVFVQPLSKVPLSLVIQNASVLDVPGFSGGAPHQVFKPLTEVPEDEMQAIVDINVGFTFRLAKHVLPLLAAAPTRHAGHVTISSGPPSSAIPWLATYSATKAAIANLSYGLDLEIKMNPDMKRKVIVQYMQVGGVCTRRLAHFGLKPTFLTPAVGDFAASLCRVLADGTQDGTACFGHALQLGLLPFIPRALAEKGVQGIALEGAEKMNEKA